MCSKACRAGLRFVSLSCFCLARQLPESITALLSCQQLFYTFLRKFLWIVKQAAFFQVLGDKKMKRTILSITSVHFIFLSGPSRRFSRPTPFPGEPLRPLGYFSKKIPTNVVYLFVKHEEVFWAERMGFEPMCPLGQTVFKTASLWPLRYLSVSVLLFCTFLARTNDMLTKRSVSVNAFSGFFSLFLCFYYRLYTHVIAFSPLSFFPFLFLFLSARKSSRQHESEGYGECGSAPLFFSRSVNFAGQKKH